MKILRFWMSLLAGTILLAACTSSPQTKPPASGTAEPVVSTRTPRPKVDAPEILQFDMLTEDTGWALTRDALLRTEDSGKTWFDITPPNAEGDVAGKMTSAVVYFLDSRTGYLLMRSVEDSSVGTIYFTEDGGETWKWGKVPFGASVLQFPDAAHGFAMMDLGAGAGSMGVAIYATSDGGANWTRVFQHDPMLDASLPLSGIKNGISFFDETRGWVTGSRPMDGDVYLFRTDDGGYTWTQQPIALPEGCESALTMTESPVFFGKTGFLPVFLFGEENQLDIYTTKDGGETWTSSPSLIPWGGQCVFYSATGAVVWNGTAFYHSEDAAQTWSITIPDRVFGDDFVQIDFTDAANGWALTLAESGHVSLYRSTNGGATWEALIP